MPKNVKISRKRRSDAPIVPATKRPRGAKAAVITARSARILALTAKTRAARAAIADSFAGVDVSDLAHLPVMVLGPARREVELEAGEPTPPPRAPIPPPVPLDRSLLSDLDQAERDRRARPPIRPLTLKERWLEARWRDMESRRARSSPTPAPPPAPVPEERQKVRESIAEAPYGTFGVFSKKKPRCGECKHTGHNARTCDHSMCDPMTCTKVPRMIIAAAVDAVLAG